MAEAKDFIAKRPRRLRFQNVANFHNVMEIVECHDMTGPEFDSSDEEEIVAENNTMLDRIENQNKATDEEELKVTVKSKVI